MSRNYKFGLHTRKEPNPITSPKGDFQFFSLLLAPCRDRGKTVKGNNFDKGNLSYTRLI